MLRVLHLIHSFNRGGIEMWLLSMLRQISRSQCEMDFCCKGSKVGPLAEIVQQQGAQVFHVPLGFDHIRFGRHLKALLVEGQYNILHNHTGVYSGFPVWIAHQLDIPVITSFHNTHFAPQTTLTRFPGIRQLRSLYGAVSINYAIHHSELITGCSQAVLRNLNLDKKKILGRSQVLYYGVNLSNPAAPAEREDFRQSLGWPANTPIILHVGRLIEQKNHPGLLNIFRLVLEHIPTAKLLLVGEGPERSAIETMINQLGLTDAVHLLGLREDVPSLMSKCDVFLFPSVHEGFGLVAIEASAANLPIVGSRIPGLTEAVKDGETALLHDVNDLEGMANSVIKLLEDKQYANQLTVSGLRWVQEHYSLQAGAENLLEIYNEYSSV